MPARRLTSSTERPIGTLTRRLSGYTTRMRPRRRCMTPRTPRATSTAPSSVEYVVSVASRSVRTRAVSAAVSGARPCQRSSARTAGSPASVAAWRPALTKPRTATTGRSRAKARSHGAARGYQDRSFTFACRPIIACTQTTTSVSTCLRPDSGVSAQSTSVTRE
jgi:hypothetical protein